MADRLLFPPTTADVAETPTPSAVDCVRMPAPQPMSPTSRPKRQDFRRPNTIMKRLAVDVT